MNTSLKNGVWPTLVTPFTLNGKVDYSSLDKMIDWHVAKGVTGIFAVCQSSEMFFLTDAEKIAMAEFICHKAGGRIDIIASGHTEDDIDDQILMLKKMADTGIQALVLVSNRLAKKEEDDTVWIKNAKKIMKAVPNMPFGIYECPYPYKRLMSPETLKWCAETGRFLFLKDTSCSIEDMTAKVEAVKGTGLKIYNAHAATILKSLQLGISGYSGVMGNFHPDLYVWLCKNWQIQPKKAQKMQDYLGFASLAECQMYPINAKYYLQLDGLPIGISSRARDASAFDMPKKMVIEQFHSIDVMVRAEYFGVETD